MHIYGFGSLCRGEVDLQSDADLLAIVESFDARFDPAAFSIYSYTRLQELWAEGNPFAWHLALESRLLFASDELDFIGALRLPARYTRAGDDCAKFRALFRDAVSGFEKYPSSRIFELSTIFLAVRNIATCFSLGQDMAPVFGRHSARALGLHSLKVDPLVYDLLVRARVLSTRGAGEALSDDDIASAASSFPLIADWMDNLLPLVSVL
jgi:hypothetical protein